MWETRVTNSLLKGLFYNGLKVYFRPFTKKGKMNNTIDRHKRILVIVAG